MRLGWCALLPLLAACRPARQTPSWADPSPHTVRMVAVAPGVTLETLDWGGHGPPLVLLGGLGDAAHSFDDFAPALTDSFHVVAYTRRGFGASSQPTTRDLVTLVADLEAVLDSLGLHRAILVGHSLAGDELTAFAATHPSSCAALVYLDAAYDRTGLLDILIKHPPPAPEPMRPADSVSVEAFRRYVERTEGMLLPEAEVRAVYAFDSTGRYLRDVTPDSVAFGILAGLTQPAWNRVACPSLAIYAVTDSVAGMFPGYAQLDPAGQAGARGAYAIFRALRDSSIARFRRGGRDNEVAQIHGAHHYVFLSHRDATLASIRSFLARRLAPPAP
jgi:non-heme chloroperoxidase